jgi:alpha-galactosidase
MIIRIVVRFYAIFLIAIFLTRVVAAAGFIGAEEIQRKDQWTQEHFLAPSVKMPFSFLYDGQASDGLLADWTKKTDSKKLDPKHTQHTISWLDPASGLEIRCVAVDYADFPAVEWTVYFKNTGANNTPILKDIQGLDTPFDRTGEGEFVLHGIKGDFCAADSYEPYHIEMKPNVEKKFAPPAYSGKSCDGPEGWPYFNLQMPGGGVILAVGWPGQWAGSFTRDGANGLRIAAGQQLTHLLLKPGEEIRTPLIAMVFWRGSDVVRSQNLWRRWYIAHVIPRVNGQPQPPIAQIQVEGSEADIANVKKFLDAGIKPDICWRDAGAGWTTWYPSEVGPYKGKDAWLNTGTWDIDPTKFPKGFKPFSDWVHSAKMKFVLWFEPERVGNPESWLGKNHPAWLLAGTDSTVGAILNEGDSAARKWLTDHVSGMIKSQGIDWYREDMNGGGPCAAWRKNDDPDRQGITENLYVQGHLAYWDELKRRHPGLCIDSCASGGRRNDLETLRRAVPLLRSDFQFPDMKGVVEGNQGHTYGLSFWLPFQGTGALIYDSYSLRSFYLPSFGMSTLTPENTAAQKKAYAECSKIAPCMMGDYYPLTPYNLKGDQWIAWQFNRPEKGDGCVQAFRRSECESASQTFHLSDLSSSAQYEVINFDREGATQFTGKDLMEKGLIIEIGDKPGSAIITYHKIVKAG